MQTTQTTTLICILSLLLTAAWAQTDTITTDSKIDIGEIPVYERWETFTTKDGLPSNKVFCVKVDGERVWAGTEKGIACYEKGQWHAYAEPLGPVMAIDTSEKTGEVWIGTMGGLYRLSGGRFDPFTQFNSGLANDIVYSVACVGDDVWAATAAGTSQFNTWTGKWEIFSEKNTLMHEPWCYNLSANDGMLYIAVWGGGVVEYNLDTKVWKEYRDPDGDMEVDLFPDDGLLHDVTAGVSYENGILWAASYFGLSRYDGRHWKTYFEGNSGLASNFINFVKARGSILWACTDNGLNSFDGTTWLTYRRTDANGKGTVTVRSENTKATRPLKNSIAHNYVWGIDFQGDNVWIATDGGVSRGKTDNRQARY